MFRRLLPGIAILALICVPEPAAAQDFAARLQDGRTVTLAQSSVPCGEPADIGGETYAIALAFRCQDPVSGMSGEGGLLVAGEPGQTSPRAWLIEAALRYAPQSGEEDRAALLVSTVATLGSGPVDFLCLPVENETRTGGETLCVLDQARTQVIVFGRSYDLTQALAVVTMILSSVSIR